MADKVIFAALPLVGTLAWTINPSPPVLLDVNAGVSRHASTPMRQPQEAFHAHSDTPSHQRDASWVRRPPSPPLCPTAHPSRTA